MADDITREPTEIEIAELSLSVGEWLHARHSLTLRRVLYQRGQLLASAAVAPPGVQRSTGPLPMPGEPGRT